MPFLTSISCWYSVSSNLADFSCSVVPGGHCEASQKKALHFILFDQGFWSVLIQQQTQPRMLSHFCRKLLMLGGFKFTRMDCQHWLFYLYGRPKINFSSLAHSAKRIKVFNSEILLFGVIWVIMSSIHSTIFRPLFLLLLIFADWWSLQVASYLNSKTAGIGFSTSCNPELNNPKRIDGCYILHAKGWHSVS